MTWHVDLMTEDEAIRCLPPDEDAGLGALRTERGNLPLDSIRLRAAVSGLAASLELTQGFRNPFDEPLEAAFIFPLPDRAAVTALRMEAAGRTVEGVLAERGQAREQYDRAVREGRRASIAEEERPGVFTMRVGNIMPAERVQIRLTLAAQLPYADGEVTFRFPLVVAPRYMPGTALPGDPVGTGTAYDTDAVPDASRISPPVLLPGFPNPVDLSIEVDVDPAGLPVKDVRSSLHVVTVDDGPGGRLRVRLAPGQRADRDFLLRLGLAGESAVTTSLAVLPDADGTAGTFALTVLPPALPAPGRPRDVVLVLDRSGSMSGWKMVAARRAAGRIVDTLGSADRFAVLAFDDVVETPAGLPPGLAEATDRNRFRAVEHLARLDARGGTEMLEPLLRAAAVLAAPAAAPGRDRVLVLVTDGQVGNEDQILSHLAAQLGGAQVYVVGIDTAVNAAFLRRLAQLGRGRCELVESEDRLDEAMAGIHRRIGAPVVTGLDLTADGMRIAPDTIAPHPLPDLFADVPLLLTGRLDGPVTGGITVGGRASTGDRWQVSVPAGPTDNAALAAIWARARIRDLEDRYVAAAETARYPGGEPPGLLERREREIVDLSLRFSVLSRFTAFVAVDTRQVNEGGTVRRVTQPVDAPHGWDMFPVRVAFAAAGPAAVPERRVRASFAALDRASAVAETTPESAVEIRAEDVADLAAEIRALAAEELHRLDEAAAASPADRVRLLARIAERLAHQVERLRKRGVDPAVLARLRRLAEELSVACATGIELDRQVAQARQVLSELAGDRATAFWKR